MEKKSNLCLFAIFATLTIAVLLWLSHWGLSGALIAMAILYGMKMSWKYGRIWWQKRQSKVAQRERFLLLLASLMILFWATGSALYLWAFYTEAEDKRSTGALLR